MIGGIFLVGMEILFLMALGMKNGDLKVLPFLHRKIKWGT
jgi:hypothetical protein